MSLAALPPCPTSVGPETLFVLTALELVWLEALVEVGLAGRAARRMQQVGPTAPGSQMCSLAGGKAGSRLLWTEAPRSSLGAAREPHALVAAEVPPVFPALWLSWRGNELQGWRPTAAHVCGGRTVEGAWPRLLGRGRGPEGLAVPLSGLGCSSRESVGLGGERVAFLPPGGAAEELAQTPNR